jgi:uncharacterized membrane protein YkoI
MDRMLRLLRPLLLLLIGIAVLVPAAPLAADDEDESEERHDHDDVRQAVERGEALPLDAVLAAVEKQVKGEVVGVEFEKEGGVWVYEFRIIDPSGRMIEVLADARTAAVIDVEGEDD